jgi:cytochrome P450/NADPH-cytochrome P450 reductase
MLGGKWDQLPPNAWQPFGFGTRGCIGRAFAWQEMQLVISSIIQRFDLSMVDPSYTLKLKQSLTIKPDHFSIQAKLRSDRVVPSLLSAPAATPTRLSAPALRGVEASGRQPIYILFGGNSGTCESFANRVATAAFTNGMWYSVTHDSGPHVLEKASQLR